MKESIVVKETIKENKEQNLLELATKADIAVLKEDIADIKEGIAIVNENIAKIHTDIALTKAELIKWMFIFCICQFAAFIAIAKFFFGK